MERQPERDAETFEPRGRTSGEEAEELRGDTVESEELEADELAGESEAEDRYEESEDERQGRAD
jgi:hypothetical protein